LARVDRVQHVRRWGLTVDEDCGQHHLLGFGEFAAMYLFSWSPAPWSVPYFADQLGGFSAAQEARVARRVLANVPNYMMWDDHEISDDWPMTFNRRHMVWSSPCGAWLIANGMAAAFVFQLQGNGLSRTDVIDALMPYLESGRHLPHEPDEAARDAHDAVTARYAAAVVPLRDFGFVAPTVPPIVFLDTRTQRELHHDRDGHLDTAAYPNLLDSAALEGLRTAVHTSGRPAHAPLLVVSPPPVLGLSALEDAQQLRWPQTIWWAEDPEAWSLDANGFVSFLTTIRSLTSSVVFFSGDVHYGFLAEGTLREEGHLDLQIVQLTSTALRNQAGGMERFGEHLAEGGGRQGFRRTDGGFEHVMDRMWETLSLGWRLRPASSLLGALVYAENNCGVVRIEWTSTGEATVTQTLFGAGAGSAGPEVTATLAPPRTTPPPVGDD
jgi:hypothetical protein